MGHILYKTNPIVFAVKVQFIHFIFFLLQALLSVVNFTVHSGKIIWYAPRFAKSESILERPLVSTSFLFDVYGSTI